MGDDKIKALLPRTFWTTVQKRLQDIVRNVPDVYGALGDEERARIDKQVESFMADLECEFRQRIDGIALTYMAEGHPFCVGSSAAIAIKDGKVKFALDLAQANVPQALYTHNGRYLVILTEGQIDWIERLAHDSGDEDGAQLDMIDTSDDPGADEVPDDDGEDEAA